MPLRVLVCSSLLLLSLVDAWHGASETTTSEQDASLQPVSSLALLLTVGHPQTAWLRPPMSRRQLGAQLGAAGLATSFASASRAYDTLEQAAAKSLAYDTDVKTKLSAKGKLYGVQDLTAALNKASLKLRTSDGDEKIFIEGCDELTLWIIGQGDLYGSGLIVKDIVRIIGDNLAKCPTYVYPCKEQRTGRCKTKRPDVEAAADVALGNLRTAFIRPNVSGEKTGKGAMIGDGMTGTQSMMDPF